MWMWTEMVIVKIYGLHWHGALIGAYTLFAHHISVLPARVFDIWNEGCGGARTRRHVLTWHPVCICITYARAESAAKYHNLSLSHPSWLHVVNRGIRNHGFCDSCIEIMIVIYHTYTFSFVTTILNRIPVLTLHFLANAYSLDWKNIEHY